MTSETTQAKPNYVIHIIYATAFVLAVLIVVAYLIWNKIQINNEIKAQQEKIRHEQEVQALKKKERELIISTCHKLVSNFHKKSLAEACVTQNNNSMRQYKNCLNDAKTWAEYNAYSPRDKYEIYAYQADQCKRQYNVNSKPNKSCVLSKSIARKINADFNNMKKSCSTVT